MAPRQESVTVSSLSAMYQLQSGDNSLSSVSADGSLKDTSRASTQSCSSSSERRRVRFCDTAYIRQVTKLTKDEGKDYWFTTDDFKAMKMTFAATIELMTIAAAAQSNSNNNDLLAPPPAIIDDDVEHCTRGLEYRTRAGAKRRMKNKLRGLASVLHEQDRQMFEEDRDDEKLSRMYQEANRSCVEAAIALGAQDALAIGRDDVDYDWTNVSAARDEAEDDASSVGSITSFGTISSISSSKRTSSAPKLPIVGRKIKLPSIRRIISTSNKVLKRIPSQTRVQAAGGTAALANQ